MSALTEMASLFARWNRTEGSYNWYDPSEKQACYRFHLRADAPAELDRSLLVDLKYDSQPYAGDTALDLARRILSVYEENYLFHGATKRAKALVTYLESIEPQDTRHRLTYELAKARADVARLESELADLAEEESE